MPTANYSFPVPEGNDSFKAHRDFKKLGDAIDATLKSEVDKVKRNINYVNALEFGVVGDGVADDTTSLQNAINSVKTSEHTETIPSNGAKAKIILPPGKVKVSSTIKVPSYIDVEGAGRHTTIIESGITNGDPIFHIVSDTPNAQQFYNTLQGFSINGNDQNCQGIKIDKTSRWVLRDVVIDRTLHEGLYIHESFLGEVYSTLVRACGDSTHNSVVLTGSLPELGSHAVNFYGGEINGGSASVNGVHLVYGASVGFFGTTIEGFANGVGLINKNGVSLSVEGCYFEGNKENYLETDETMGTNFVGNYCAPTTASTRGHIGIFYAQGAKIEGNYLQGSGKHIFDSTGNNTGKLYMSSVKTNITSTFPMNIDNSLVSSASTTGTVMEMFDGNFSAYVYGRRRYKDIALFEEDVRPSKGIHLIGDLDNVAGTNAPSLTSGFGAPEGLRTANPGSLYLRTDSASDHLYIKDNGTAKTGWRQYQGILSGTSANRPTNVITGTQYFDTTLHKPIWRDLALNGWVDATGTIV